MHFNWLSGDRASEPWPRPAKVTPLRPTPPCPNAASRRRARPIRSARRRCKEVDLNRWLSGSYVIPGRDDEEDDEAEDGRKARTEQSIGLTVQPGPSLSSCVRDLCEPSSSRGPIVAFLRMLVA